MSTGSDAAARTGAFVIFSCRFVKSLCIFSTSSVVAIFIFLASCSLPEGLSPRDRSVYGSDRSVYEIDQCLSSEDKPCTW